MVLIDVIQRQRCRPIKRRAKGPRDTITSCMVQWNCTVAHSAESYHTDRLHHAIYHDQSIMNFMCSVLEPRCAEGPRRRAARPCHVVHRDRVMPRRHAARPRHVVYRDRVMPCRHAARPRHVVHRDHVMPCRHAARPCHRVTERHIHASRKRCPFSCLLIIIWDVYHLRTVGDVRISQLNWKRVPQARSRGCKSSVAITAECLRHHASRNVSWPQRELSAAEHKTVIVGQR